MAFSHKCGETVVAAVHEDAVGNAHVAFNVHMKCILISGHITFLRNGRSFIVGKDTSGKDTFVGRARPGIVDVCDTITVIFT